MGDRPESPSPDPSGWLLSPKPNDLVSSQDPAASSLPMFHVKHARSASCFEGNLIIPIEREDKPLLLLGDALFHVKQNALTDPLRPENMRSQSHRKPDRGVLGGPYHSHCQSERWGR